MKKNIFRSVHFILLQFFVVVGAFYPIYLLAADIEEIIVTAKPLSFQGEGHMNIANSVLSGEELRRKKHNQIGETLANELGVNSSSYGPASSRPVIRGLGGGRLRVLQDGIGSMDVSTASADHAVAVNPMQAQSIEILRGPATLLYGSGAIAGLVNVTSNRIPKQALAPKASFDMRYNSALFGPTAGFLAEAGTDNVAFHLDSTVFNYGDYMAADRRIANTHNRAQEISFGMSMLGEDEYVGVSYTHHRRFYGLPANPDEPDELASIDLEQDKLELAGKIMHPLPMFDSLRFTSGYSNYLHNELDSSGAVGSVFVNKELESRIELNHMTLGRWDGAIGVQYRHRDFSSTGEESFIPISGLDNIGLFLLEDTHWGNLHFEVGGRYEYQRSKEGSFSTQHNLYNISAAVAWEPIDSLELYLLLSRAERAPSLEELFANGPHHATATFERGNRHLNKEIANDVDAGFHWRQLGVNWTVNLFAYRFEDFIYADFVDNDNDGEADEVDEDGAPGGELLAVFYRQQNALFYGVELSADFPVYTASSSEITGNVFADWVQGRIDGGEFLPRISPPRIGMSFDYTAGSWQANITGVHVLRQGKTATLETATGGYFLLGLDLNYRFKTIGAGEVSWYCKLSNLFNEDALQHTSFIKDRVPLPGRAVMLGFNVSY